MRIRNATLADKTALFDICLRTANAGEDARALFADPKMPGQVWSVPYLYYDPSLVFLVADDQNVWGYIVGVAETARYEKWLVKTWFPKLRSLYANFVPNTESEQKTLDWINQPRPDLDPSCVMYPAHLHINLLPEVQTGGWGRKLIEALIDALEARDVVGLHLDVNPSNTRAIGFYEHLGFADLKIESGKKMGLKLRPR